MATRPAAVAGSWYPGTEGALRRDVEAYLQIAPEWSGGTIRAVVAPHAGLMFSGPVGAYAYKAAAASDFDVAVLVGPSHYVGFDGVALYPEGAFATPLGHARIDERGARSLQGWSVVQAMPSVHRREHSLEMQLPFLTFLMPDTPIVPLLMGYQTRQTIVSLAEALGGAFADRNPLLVASTDLSHYFDDREAERLDTQVRQYVSGFDAEGLLEHFERYPEHERGRYVACGGGPLIAVMMAARTLGARTGRVLRYSHSGEISGDNSGVVGYVAAVFGSF